MKKALRRPTAASVRGYLAKWKKLAKYVHQEKALNRLFQKLCPGNKDLLSVLVKVSALNDFYSTNIYGTHTVAEHIVALGCDRRIKDGDVSLVNEMALVRIGKKKRNFYSFASKYCNHHRQQRFPIFDSYVEQMLWHFKKKDGFAEFKRIELKQYARFVQIIREFRKFYTLQRFNLRQIDIYLWLTGKDAFGKFKKPKKPAA